MRKHGTVARAAEYIKANKFVESGLWEKYVGTGATASKLAWSCRQPIPKGPGFIIEPVRDPRNGKKVIAYRLKTPRRK